MKEAIEMKYFMHLSEELKNTTHIVGNSIAVTTQGHAT